MLDMVGETQNTVAATMTKARFTATDLQVKRRTTILRALQSGESEDRITNEVWWESLKRLGQHGFVRQVITHEVTDEGNRLLEAVTND